MLKFCWPPPSYIFQPPTRVFMNTSLFSILNFLPQTYTRRMMKCVYDLFHGKWLGINLWNSQKFSQRKNNRFYSILRISMLSADDSYKTLQKNCKNKLEGRILSQSLELLWYRFKSTKMSCMDSVNSEIVFEMLKKPTVFALLKGCSEIGGGGRNR